MTCPSCVSTSCTRKVATARSSTAATTQWGVPSVGPRSSPVWRSRSATFTAALPTMAPAAVRGMCEALRGSLRACPRAQKRLWPAAASVLTTAVARVSTSTSSWAHPCAKPSLTRALITSARALIATKSCATRMSASVASTAAQLGGSHFFPSENHPFSLRKRVNPCMDFHFHAWLRKSIMDLCIHDGFANPSWMCASMVTIRQAPSFSLRKEIPQKIPHKL